MELLSVSVLNTAQTRQVTREAFSDLQIDRLTRLVTNNGGNLPGPHEAYSLELHHVNSGILVWVHFEKTPLLVAMFAWGSSEENWKKIEEAYLKISERLPASFAGCEAPEAPGALPWLAIMRSQFGNIAFPGVLRWLEEIMLPSFAFAILAEVDRQSFSTR